jgi:hypothetical protein
LHVFVRGNAVEQRKQSVKRLRIESFKVSQKVFTEWLVVPATLSFNF